VFVNNIHTGKRVGKMIHALEGHITTSDDDPPEFPYTGYTSNDDNDILIMGVYYKNWISGKEINDLLLSIAPKNTPEIGNDAK